MKRVLLVCFCSVLGLAQQNPAALAARNWRETHERALLTEFMDFLALPNLASDAAAVRKNATAIVSMLEKRGGKADFLEAARTPPVVLGEMDTPRAARQPV